MSFLLITAFIVSHKFEYVVLHFQYILKCILSFLFWFFSLNKLALCRMLFTFHVYVGYLFFLLINIRLNSWWSDRVHGIISIFLFLLSTLLRLSQVYDHLEKLPWGVEKKMYSFFLGQKVPKISVKSIRFLNSVGFTLSLFIFWYHVLAIDESGVLTSLTIIVWATYSKCFEL